MRLMSLSILVLLMLSTGCEQSGPKADNLDAGQESPDTTRPQQEPSNINEGAAGTASMQEENPEQPLLARAVLIRNADFEQGDVIPTHWIASESKAVSLERRQVAEGKSAVRVSGTAQGSFNSVLQDVDLGLLEEGAMLRVTARAHCSQPHSSQIRVQRRAGRSWVRSDSVAHPGDGLWHQLQVDHELPRSFEGTVRIILLDRRSEEGTIFDEVEVSLLPL